MGLKIDCKTKEGAYEKIREKLTEKDYNVLPPQKIEWGLQFQVTKQGHHGVIRIFESKKKGVTLDSSTIKDKEIEKDTLLIFGYSTDEELEAPIKEKGDFYSLCIGVDTFESRIFQDLKFAKKDAEDVHEIIENKFGDNSKNICLLNEEATKEKIIHSLNLIQENAKKEDTVMIFIATHGDAVGFQGSFEYYIIPHDINENDISKTAVSMKEMREIVSKIKSDKKIIFIDTCHSGGISRRDRNRIPEHTVEVLFNEISSENFVMISSSQPDQPSFEDERIQQGVFTHFLIRGLTGNVQSNNGNVELYTLYTFLFKSVNEYSQTYFKTLQKPKFFGSITGPFHLPLFKNITPLSKIKEKFSFEKINCVGIDESGKGDFFGPLVVAAVYVNTPEKIEQLRIAGVKDSKKINDLRKIKIIADKIKKLCDNEVISISPKRYNELWQNMGSVNEILAWGHSQSLERLLQRNPSCDLAISDQFAGKEILLNKLKEKGKQIELLQRPKAEENIAVAAASILARNEFLNQLLIISRVYLQIFPRGENEAVIIAKEKFIKNGGNLSDVAKTHFKTTEKKIQVKEVAK